MLRSMVTRIADNIQPPNPKIANGISWHQSKDGGALSYLNEVVECAAKDFPAGVTYEGYKPCSPEEEYAFLTRARGGKSDKKTFEIQQSDVYLVKYMFALNGDTSVLNPVYLLLPNIKRYGRMRIMGNTYFISPVLADPLMSVGKDSIFTIMTRDKFTFERSPYSFIANGDRVVTKVAWSWLHKKAYSKNNGKTAKWKAKTTLVHYMFSKFGFTETMRRFAHVDPIVGTTDITPDKYPAEDWVVCESVWNTPTHRGYVPKGVKRDGYAPSEIRIAIPKDKWTQECQAIIAAFFYTVDRYPRTIGAKDVDATIAWATVLGYILDIYSASEGLMLQNVLEKHIPSLEDTLDTMVKRRLEDIGIPSEDIYDLMFYLTMRLAYMGVVSDSELLDLWSKRFIVLRYTLSEIINKVNRCMYTLNEEASRRELDPKTVNMALRTIQPTLILGLNSGQKHPEAKLSTSSGECTIFTDTYQINAQGKAGHNASNKGKIDKDDPRNHASPDKSRVNGFTFITGADPTKNTIVNPMLDIDGNGRPVFPIDELERIETLRRQFSV